MVLLAGCSSDDDAADPQGDERLRQDAAGAIEIRRSGPTATIRGRLPAVEASEAGARRLVEQYPDVFGLGPDDGVEVVDRIELGDGFLVVRLLRVHRGLPVFAGEVRIGFSPDGAPVFVVAPAAGPLDVAGDAAIDSATAQATALAVAASSVPSPAITSETLGVLVPSLYGASGAAGLGYRFELRFADDSSHVVFVDATSGSVSLEFSGRSAALSRTVHEWQGDADWIPDLAAPVLVREGDPPPDAGATDLELAAYQAYLYVGTVHQYLGDRFGWDSWDGRGSEHRVFVGNPEANAGWFGTYSAFGRGQVAADIVAHELGHGVVDATVNRPYGSTTSGFVACGLSLENWLADAPVACGESQALDEWVGDALAAFASFHAGTGDWLIESEQNVERDMIQGVAHRTIVHYREVASAPKEGHRNSAIPSLATYLLADPAPTHPLGAGAPPFRSIGLEKVEEIFFRALRLYLRSTATFDDTRYAWLRACEDLVDLGRVGLQVRDCGAVLNAWAAVGVGPPDEDEDTWHDEVDNCPAVFNDGQEDGDGDGVGDACDEPPDGDGVGHIEGSGVDRDSHDALEMASGHLFDADEMDIGQAFTDASGQFAFRDLPAGTYRLRAEKADYFFETLLVDVQADQTVRADVSLRFAGGVVSPRQFDCPASFATTGGYGSWPLFPAESGEVVCANESVCGGSVSWECAYSVPVERQGSLTGFTARLTYVNESAVVSPCPAGGEFEVLGVLYSGTHEASASVPFTDSDPLGMPGFAAGSLAFREQLLRQAESTNAVACE